MVDRDLMPFCLGSWSTIACRTSKIGVSDLALQWPPIESHTSMSKLSRKCLVVLMFVCFACAEQEADAASPAGKWRGGWTSQSTGHAGTLGARIRVTGPDSYRAMFYGRFAKVIPFVYPAKLHRVPGSCDCYTSTTRLPLLGTYRMSASVFRPSVLRDFQRQKGLRHV